MSPERPTASAGGADRQHDLSQHEHSQHEHNEHGKIVFDDVSMSFASPRRLFGKARPPVDVIRNLSFSVRDGEFLGVLGPSGCGKSTLLNMVAGFLKPTGGTVLVDGRTVTGPDHRRGVVFQQYAIFPWMTVAENIGFGLTLGCNRRSKKEIAATVARYVDLMGLGGFEKALPKTLSGGMRQRVAIARAYATEPEVLLMDEPFAALDAQTREYMQESLYDAARSERRTAMFITHSVEEAIYLSDRVVLLSNRPTGVREELVVDVPQPRTPETRLTPAFIELRRHLEEVLRSMSKSDSRPSTLEGAHHDQPS